jgi:DNA-binding NarL/FixJ family response regulator
MSSSFKIFTKKLNKKSKLQLHFMSQLSRDYLKFLQVNHPTSKQIVVMENLIFRRYIPDLYTIPYPLSTIELKCLYLASEGYDIQTIAELLDISHRTVERYRTVINQKLNCRNIIQSIKKALEKGIIR